MITLQDTTNLFILGYGMVGIIVGWKIIIGKIKESIAKKKSEQQAQWMTALQPVKISKQQSNALYGKTNQARITPQDDRLLTEIMQLAVNDNISTQDRITKIKALQKKMR